MNVDRPSKAGLLVFAVHHARRQRHAPWGTIADCTTLSQASVNQTTAKVTPPPVNDDGLTAF